MWSSKRSPGPALLRRLCTLGLPLETVAPALMRALCREAQGERGIVLWFDSQGAIANLYVHDLPSPQALAGWFPADANTIALPARRDPASGPARHKVIEICTDVPQAQTLATSPVAEPSCPHRRLCAMAVPSGLPTQRLCCAVVKDGAPVAALIVYRPSLAPAFSSEARLAVKAAGRYLSLNSGAPQVDTSAAMYRGSGEDALLLCNADGDVVKASGNGYALLAQASGCAVSPGTVPHGLQRAGRALVRDLLGEPARPVGREPRGPTRAAARINDWGLFRLRTFFERDGPLGLLIERADHLLVRLCEAMWRRDLSVQQGEALLLLAQGLSQAQVADRMGIALNTAAYHIRHLYAKLGAHTRNEAIACVLAWGEGSADG